MKYTDEQITARNSLGGSIIGWICTVIGVIVAYIGFRLFLDIIGIRLL